MLEEKIRSHQTATGNLTQFQCNYWSLKMASLYEKPLSTYLPVSATLVTECHMLLTSQRIIRLHT